MWTGRFQQATDALVRAYGESISFDWRLYPYDIEGSVAHAAALAAAGLISEEERAAIEAGLREIGGEIARGEFSFKTELEDIHMNIEAALTQRIGPAGAKLHTARSRNDQVALDLRLYLRAEIAEVRRALRGLQRALIELGARHPEAVMPGYTHLQRAQPVLFAHHLLAYVAMFDRDAGRRAAGAADPVGDAEVYVSGGRRPTGRRLVDWAREAEQRGAGEILLTSMDSDGTRAGFDCELTARVSEAVQIPVIASGGAGSAAHFAEVFTRGKADAALAASIFHFGVTDSRALKGEVALQGVPMRLPC